jgi:hypothetical protein
MNPEIIQTIPAQRLHKQATSIAKPERITVGTLIAGWVIALTPHLLVVLIFLKYPIALDDMYQYDMIARSLSSGSGYRWYSNSDVEVLEPYYSKIADLSKINFPENGFLTAFRAPGYPVFLSGLYSLVSSQSRFMLARLVQAGLLALLTPAAILFSTKMGFGRKSAILAGLGIGFYPILLLYPVGLASENLFIPLVSLSLLALIYAMDTGGVKRVILAGCFLGAVMLTRSILAPFVLLASVWFAHYGKMGKKAGALLLLVAFGMCIPSAARNTWIMKRPAFVESSLGYNLFVGYHPEGNGGFVSKVAILPMTITDDAERDGYCTEMAWNYIKSYPAEAARRVFHRAIFFMGVETREFSYFYSNNYLGHIPQPWLALVYSLLVVPWISTVFFSLLGFEMTSKKFAFLVLAFFIGYVVPHFFVLAEPRFHLALLPVLIPFAAKGWTDRKPAIRRLEHQLQTFPVKVAICYYTPFCLIILLWLFDFTEKWSTLLALMGPNGNKLFMPY